MSAALTLVSHALCPYVQRAAIVLHEKGVSFERREVDLARKPDWFLEVSPLGRTPVLLAGHEAIFESAVICEYLEDTLAPPLHPQDPLQRARERAWMAFGSSLLDTIGAFYNAPDEDALAARAGEIRARFEQVEDALHAQGPWFGGERFGMVDAVFGPMFRYFDAFERIADFRFLRELPRVAAWRAALAARPSVRAAAHPEYAARLDDFLRRRGSALSRRMRQDTSPVKRRNRLCAGACEGERRNDAARPRRPRPEG